MANDVSYSHVSYAHVPYAELHCRSNFSFLQGASHPEQLVEQAQSLGLETLALTDRNGLYGIVRFAEAARVLGLPTVFGAELQLDSGSLVIIARNPRGYAHLSGAISAGQLAGSKEHPVFVLEQLGEFSVGDWWVMTGGRDGAVVRALNEQGPSAAERRVQQMKTVFGNDSVLMEVWDHGDPLDSARNDVLVQIAHRNNLTSVATNDVLYATARQHRLATAVAAVRERSSLDDVDATLPPAATAYVRSGAEQHRRFARYPGVVQCAAEIGKDAAFDLRLVAPRLPPFPCPNGLDEMSYLRQLVQVGATRRYGIRPSDTREDLSLRARAWRVIDHELEVIATLGFAGYFLVVWDIVQFCQRSNIFCQGRGSAANSAVCYSLDITKADAVSLGLLFERFLSPERDGPPDIDIDIESGRREEVIQYVYQRHGRHHAAQVANVITYRARSAVRDMSRALGFAPGQQDAWSKQVDAWGSLGVTVKNDDHNIPAAVLELAQQVQDAPRHLGIHSGGMVMCDRPVTEVCPVEWGRMEGRSVLQWDKDDCAAAGLVKFDLLGLGMLSALHNAVDLIEEFRGVRVDLATIPQEDDVYAMLCRADTVGVFQIESRAQMATLPRLKPRRFYDLVVEVALIRPGPIQGGSVHPYIRRRNGQEPVTYLHPLLENSLGKTLGVPLFQEQLMQMAIDVAGFTPSEADELRQAMGSKRSQSRMLKLSERLYAGMAERGIVGDVADLIFTKMSAFASYGFPESHSVSFAYLVYSSAWIKLHEPAVFCASLLNAQPMGFWAPHSLVQDAKRHGVVVRSVDINASRADATLEECGESTGGLAVRLGVGSVRGLSSTVAREIETHRPFANMEDLVRKVPQLHIAQLEALATAGAFNESFGQQRRDALWSAGAVIQSRPDRLQGVTTGAASPQLPGMQPLDEMIADLWATGVASSGHPTEFLRAELTRMGVATATELPACGARGDDKVLVAGTVTHRQRPATAQGVTFIGLEDETGLINVVCSPGCWIRYRIAARGAGALLVRGRLEVGDGGVINVVAEHIAPLSVGAKVVARNFR
ncbi:MAG: DNA polymerase III subunit alpha [Actinobacteria bacterium]|uniref:Error-prone DNA polymerase n=1 Tax=freshwater metagenome TaxID=449393 RepID=A0A6J6WZ19_9ZZZZ|nr:DNA polymerase III subunit alpha [Actinomycetota bacterium]